jgi:hypothetical protein
MNHRTLYVSILLLGLITNWARAQISTEYQPMAVEGAHWICYKAYDKPWGDEYFSWTIRGDTLIRGKIYKKMYRDDLFIDHVNKKLSNPPVVTKISLTALIRDDTFQRKVFGIIPPNSGLYRECIEGGQETLLFDFSASSGDTLQSCLLGNLAKRSSLLVDSITYTPYECFHTYGDKNDEKQLRTLNVNGYWESTFAKNRVKILERIGYQKYGPFFEQWRGSGGIILEWQKIGGLLCYCVGTNADCNIITSSKEISYLPIRIFPNPVEDRLYFESNSTPLKWLRVYHSSGLLINELFHISASGSYIDTYLLQPGHYYLQGLGEGGEIYLGKFIKL